MKKCGGIFLTVMLLCFPPFFYSGEAHASSEENIRIIVKYKDSSHYSFAKKGKQKNLEVKSIKKQEFSKIKKELESKEEVEYVEEDSFYYYTSVNDPYYTYQKEHFRNINVEAAWSEYKQKDKPTIAVLDSGIDHNHPDLKSVIVKPYNVLSPGEMPMDDIGHGTHVAGIAGAKTNNTTGIASIVKDAYIMPVKVGAHHGAFISDIAEGIVYAVNNNADIINISIAGPKKSETLKKAVDYAASRNVLVVAAAGNNAANNVEYPAGYPGVFSVAASDLSGRLASFSNYGPWVSVAAPGVNVFSTLPVSQANTIKGYGNMNGTSMAAPMVASHAALLKSIDKQLSPGQLQEIIEVTSTDETNYPVQNGQINVLDSLKYYHSKNRISGKNSLETSMEVAKEGWKSVNETSISSGSRQLKGKFAVLASNQTFADSLSVVPLAYKIDSPIFLSERSFFPQSSISSMKEMGVNHIIVIGGEQAISTSVENKLTNNGFTTSRISGKTRYDTAVEISKFVAGKNGEVMIVNGKSFPDALSASVEAAKRGMPIVFTEQTWVPGATKEFLSNHQFSRKYIIGGKQPVSSSVEKSLSAVRISGANRYETNVAVAEYFNRSYSGYYVATGADYKDALTGGLLAAKQNKGLILVRPANIDPATQSYLSGHKHPDYKILGGTSAVDSAVLWKIDKILSGN